MTSGAATDASGRAASTARWVCQPGSARRPSPNRGARVGVDRPDLVVVHYTAMTSAEAAVDRLCDPAAAVSAHYVVGEAGALTALVDETERAWHAGVSCWRRERDVNSRSIGIELAHPGRRPGIGAPPFPEPQMRALEALLGGMFRRWGLSAPAVVAHSDVAPERKDDPGESFDWARLARIGVAIGPDPAAEADAPRAAADPAAMDAALDAVGYGPWSRAARLAAFRARFRPWAVGGTGDAAAAPTAADLAAATRAAALTMADSRL